MGSIPGRGTRIPHAVQCGQENKNKERKKQDLNSANTMENEGRNIMSLTTQQKCYKAYSSEIPLYMSLCKATTEEREYMTWMMFLEHRGTTVLVGNRNVFFLLGRRHLSVICLSSAYLISSVICLHNRN